MWLNSSQKIVESLGKAKKQTILTYSNAHIIQAETKHEGPFVVEEGG